MAQSQQVLNTANGGLGLAITRKLLSLHHTSIEVASEVGAGTKFMFNLQASTA